MENKIDFYHFWMKWTEGEDDEICLGRLISAHFSGNLNAIWGPIFDHLKGGHVVLL